MSKGFSIMNHSNTLFSVYQSDYAVELRSGQDPFLGNGQLILTQPNYNRLHQFASSLAQARGLPLWDYAHFDSQYEY
ncbi:MAG: hypothetical protein AAFY78_06435 [Cyanobacteria bacterium J06648_16]